MVYVTYVISACICATAIIFLFRKVFGSGNSFELLPLAWFLRMTLKLRVTSWSTWHLLFLGTCICPTAMIFCFVRFSGRGIHSDYCHLRDHHVWPWNVRSRHGLLALTTWQNKKSRRQWRDLRFLRSSGKITQLAIARMNSLNQKPHETKKQSSR